MSSPTCTTSPSLATLLAYWLGELEAAAENEVEDHLFSCAECSARLRELVALGEGIRRETRGGTIFSVMTARLVSRLQAAGLRIREYRMQPGGSVLCTVAPEDDLVVGHLHAALAGVERLDLLIHNPTAGLPMRLEDVAFDPRSDEIVLVPSVKELRRLTHETMRVELLAVESNGEKSLGEYTFNHHAHASKR